MNKVYFGLASYGSRQAVAFLKVWGFRSQFSRKNKDFQSLKTGLAFLYKIKANGFNNMFRNGCYWFFVAVINCCAVILFGFSPSLFAFGSDVLAGCFAVDPYFSTGFSEEALSSSILVPESELIPEYNPQARAMVSKLQADPDTPLFVIELDMPGADDDSEIEKQRKKYIVIINEYGEKEIIEIDSEKQFKTGGGVRLKRVTNPLIILVLAVWIPQPFISLTVNPWG